MALVSLEEPTSPERIPVNRNNAPAPFASTSFLIRALSKKCIATRIAKATTIASKIVEPMALF
jgi:hypothetical protein